MSSARHVLYERIKITGCESVRVRSILYIVIVYRQDQSSRTFIAVYINIIYEAKTYCHL